MLCNQAPPCHKEKEERTKPVKKEKETGALKKTGTKMKKRRPPHKVPIQAVGK